MELQTGLDLAATASGFAEPVADSQKVFRLLLDAMAHPGRILALPQGILPVSETGLSDTAAATALALLDFETPVWLDGRSRPAAEFLRFHCGAPVVTDPKASRFAFAADPTGLPPLDAFDLGSEDYPDRSTTLVLDVAALNQGGALTLRGPGIATTAHLGVSLDAGFWRARAELAELFPLGLDLVLTCGRRLMALPRTTIVEGF